MTAIFPRLSLSTGEILLDMLACAYADAFDEAETNVATRAEIVELFDIDTLRRLRARHCITWDPDTVPVQEMMEVGL